MTTQQIEAALKVCEETRIKHRTCNLEMFAGDFMDAATDPKTGYEAALRELLKCQKALAFIRYALLQPSDSFQKDLCMKTLDVLNEALAESEGGGE